MKKIGRLATRFLLAHAIAAGGCTLAATAAAEGPGTDPATQDFITKQYGLEQAGDPPETAAQPSANQGDITVGAIVEALTRPAVEDTAVAYRRPHVDLDIKFEFDSAKLTERGKRDLDVAAEALDHAQLRSSRFLLAGHTDSAGAPDHNEALSLERAESAYKYLVDKRGIDASRLETIGFGSRKPRVEGVSLEARRMNRRVVIELIQ
jgi:outer membrane protein OmpA-like peptidoglycan-associated protein